MTYDAETGELPLANGHHIPEPPRIQPAPMLVNGGAGITQALHQAYGELPHFIATESKGAHNIKYANLETILRAVRPILWKYGIRIRQGERENYPCDEGGGSKGRLSIVYTELVHVYTGQREVTEMRIPYSRLNAQDAVSALTYGRRYTLCEALGLATGEGDDDGQQTRSRKITDQPAENAEIIKLKAEIAKAKDMTSLLDWAEKNEAKLNKLTEDERMSLRVEFAKRREALGKE
jgi:hypothetical protein